MKIALLGFGTVGSGVYEILQEKKQAGLQDLSVTRALVKEINSEMPDFATENFADIANDDQIDTVVEMMGGLHPAYEFLKTSIEKGKNAVTSNKLLVSVYGEELNALAKSKGTAFLFSAACGGGIPYLCNLQRARRSDTIQEVGGILNGTTNFMVDAMQRNNMSFAAALKEAQKMGYAEADPSSDVDGLDTMRKCILSSAVGFDLFVNEDSIVTEGIGSIDSVDIEFYQHNGWVCRLITHAGRTDKGIYAYVEPTCFGPTDLEVGVTENKNIAWFKSEYEGKMSFYGQGAGKFPTAANVVMDLLDISEGKKHMLNDTCVRVNADNRLASHRYAVRVDKETVCEELDSITERQTVIGSWEFHVTKAVTVESMHSLARRLKEKNTFVFFAGIADEEESHA